jgi:hypothetical protein
MRRFSLVIFITFLSIAQTHIAAAGYSLKVSVREYNSISMEADQYIFPNDDPQALLFKKKVTAYAKSNKAKSEALTQCKEDGYYYNTRIKVLDARNGTAGLGNLKSVTVSNMKVVAESYDLPQYTEEESEYLDSEYLFYDEYPDYIEEGYVSYNIEFTCNLVGTVSIISSNAYKIYIDGDFAGEYSSSELAKRKWAIFFDDL